MTNPVIAKGKANEQCPQESEWKDSFTATMGWAEMRQDRDTVCQLGVYGFDPTSLPPHPVLRYVKWQLNRAIHRNQTSVASFSEALIYYRKCHASTIALLLIH